MSYKAGDVINFEYTGSVQTVTLPKGKYKLECWGAQGGYRSSSDYGGKGGYSTGILTLTNKTTLYVYAGGAGNTVPSATNYIYPGGFNGGGYRYNYKGGGGASDIRIATDSLYARVIVAGGGGSDGATNKKGMYGGGTAGGDATENFGSYGHGGTQTGHTTSVSIPSSQYTEFTNTTNKYQGGFGFGGFGCYSNSGYGGAGGGGWYGGCGSVPDVSGDDDRGGGGGSGYVYTSSTASNYPSGCLLNSSYYLTDASTIAGNTSFTAPNGASETGHSGNGYCRITVIEANYGGLMFKLNNQIKVPESIHIKLNGSWINTSSAIKPGKVFNFQYIDSVQTITLPPGKYKLECWGAQGGTYSSYIGGKGGYSVGTLTLTEKTTLYVYTGGAGSSTGITAGYNGGGDGVKNGRGGGGGSDIRIGRNSLYARIIVAGGGGGAGVTTANVNPAGCGGGTYGGDGYYNNTTGRYTTGYNRSGGSASQTAGGISWNSQSSTKGIFGKGGNASTYSCGGGGGGWYGGGGAYDNDSDSDGHWGGGGSGYVYTSSTASNYPSGCLLDSSYYLSDAQTIAGNTAFTSPSGSSETGHTGNGYCRITVISCSGGKMYIKQNGVWIQTI